MENIVQMFNQNTALLISCAAILGILIGSFLNVVILRLPPRMEWEWKREATDFLDLPLPEDSKPPIGLVVESSRCPKCGHSLSWWENIPLLSYILLRGKCRGCKVGISSQYPIVEALTGILFALSAWQFGAGAFLVATFVMLAILVAAVGIDARVQLLPDSLVYPILWLGLLASAFSLPGAIELKDSVLGAFAGYMSLWTVFWIFKIVRGKEGMGYGDFKLLAALGAWCGLSSIFSIILISTVVGAVVGIFMMAINNKNGEENNGGQFAFGPYLAAAGMIEFFCRGWLNNILS